jgi:divalent metal cation (Fe/Co/Zn/Cd) transporter
LGRDAPVALRDEITSVLRDLVRQGGPIGEVHDVRVRETPRGLIVNFHCRALPRLSVEEVHRAVDDLERRLCEARHDVRRAIGHAEPAA